MDGSRAVGLGRVDVGASADLGEGGFVVVSDQGEFRGRSLVIATGGPSIPKMGSSGFGYKIGEQFGLKIVPPRAGLVPLTFDAALLAQCDALSGIGGMESSRWIDNARLPGSGATVLNAEQVMSRHVANTLRQHAHVFVGIQETTYMLEQCAIARKRPSHARTRGIVIDVSRDRKVCSLK